MPLKKSVRAKKTTTHVNKTAAPAIKEAPPVSKSAASNVWSAWAIAAGIVGVVIVAAVFAARGPSPVHDGTSIDAAQPASDASTADVKKVAGKKTAASSTPSQPDAINDELPSAGARVAGAVDVSGCLQRDDRLFVLKDTEGAAPKSRSWKTGFLKKSSASIQLNDTGNAAHLADHVGQRVSVTGTLIDREMHVQSLRRLSATCG